MTLRLANGLSVIGIWQCSSVGSLPFSIPPGALLVGGWAYMPAIEPLVYKLVTGLLDFFLRLLVSI